MKLRDLSCRVGEHLRIEYANDREKNGWAATMVAQIRMQREQPSMSPA